MKKFAALILAVAMMMSLAACGGKQVEAAAPTDTTTVAVGAVIIARDDVPDDVVYAFVSDIFEKKADIAHAKAGELDLAFASSVTSVPYHPGAAKYFAEKGFNVASVKSGAGGSGSAGEITFATGGTGGTYYAFGTVIAGHATANSDYTFTGIPGEGSKANVLLLSSSDAQMAFCQSDVMAYAFSGTNTFATEGKVDCFSVVASLYMEQVQIVTTNGAITSVADLKGKSVSVGAPGSGVYYNAVDVLAAYDMTLDDIKANYQDFNTSADSLANGQIDAAFIVAGAPTTAVTQLVTTNPNTRLVTLDDEHITKLLASSPYYSKNVIAKDVYFGS